MFAVLIASVFLFVTIKADQVCYVRLGCFTDDFPWAGTVERPIAKLPWNPEKINTRFLLYSKQNPSNYQEITARNPSTISGSNFSTNRKTRFIIHGFIDQGEEAWLSDMCKLFFQVEDVNCICVDWSAGSRCPYSQAVHNIRVVGAEMAYIIDILQTNFSYPPSNIHIIGHSLGAHAAAEAGRRKRGISRITGLDPAEPFFQSTPIEVRLNPTDAVFVDVIHTDAAPIIPNFGFGMMQAVGHIDFYPNGGEYMPGCQKNAISQIVDIDGIWEGTRDFVACNHLRAYKYYSDSITAKDGFIGYQCSTYESFKSGDCLPCPRGSCPLMGHYADSYRVPLGTVNQKFYLNTGDARPFARWRYKVSVKITGNRATHGFINISLFGNNGNTKQHQIVKANLKPGNTYTNYIDVEVNVREMIKVKFLWDNSQINPFFPKLGAENVTVERQKDGQVFTFCGSGTVGEEVLQTLNVC
ncbi:pancreatic triacylglycerol lipase-like [Latimeria chalumnae]|uniref:Triacylglycerol lipase n=1 Tax=Latimeria chalumnae TaxID=7897 RepID=M3XH31_LATCH|nr:PREDICTED: pancreatic triacylglycerol lipase-like [Latimeria chalumnae]|eukprot:XP_014343729.1 PREDICTED: pancreatic triacylglycerol lipase-like [Latimeria chalumnae]